LKNGKILFKIIDFVGMILYLFLKFENIVDDLRDGCYGELG
jgi:hypothetical protein